MGNEASTLINELQTNIESKLERLQPIQIIRDDPAEERVPDLPTFRRGHSEEVKQALANEDSVGQKTFTDAVQRAKSTEMPEISEVQKSGIYFIAVFRHHYVNEHLMSSLTSLTAFGLEKNKNNCEIGFKVQRVWGPLEALKEDPLSFRGEMLGSIR